MKLENMILVVNNRTRKETNYLSSFSDYMKHIEEVHEGAAEEIWRSAERLYETKDNKTQWDEIYITANETLSARFCANQEQLRGFLFGVYNNEIEGKRNYVFNEERCSKECFGVLEAYGIKTDGHSHFNSLHYEQMEHNFKMGEIVRNLNGSDYRILEVLSPKNLLLMAQSTGEYLVAVGMQFFKRTPKSDDTIPDSAIYGIEWGQGIYLGNKIPGTSIDAIRSTYGILPENESLFEYCERQKSQFDLYQNLSENKSLTDTVRRAADKSLEILYSTENRETFLHFLEKGCFDGGYGGIGEREPEKLR